MKNFLEYLNNGYMIPNSLAIGNGEETDIRSTCATVDDFEYFYQQSGMELRYSGLVTFEWETDLFKGCIEEPQGVFNWVVLNLVPGESGPEIADLQEQVDDIKKQLSMVHIEFE